MQRKKCKVSIIILNWNGWKDTIECLESLFNIDYPNYEIIMVDNGSQNDSLNRIKIWAKGYKLRIFEFKKTNRAEEKYFSKKRDINSIRSNKKLIILKNDKNYGFAEGNNIAMRQVLEGKNSEYILLLNNDTTVDKKFLRYLLEEYKDDVGMVGPSIYDYYNPNRVHSAGGIVSLYSTYSLTGGDTHKKANPKRLHYLSGCCILVKTDILKMVGLFDPIYFYYVEDIDLGYRVYLSRKKIVCSKKSKLWHKEGSSVGGNIKNNFTVFYEERNRVIFIKKFGKLRHKLFFTSYHLFKIVYFFLKKYPIERKLIKSRIRGFIYGWRENVKNT